MRLLGDRVAIIPIEDPDKHGALWVPEQAKQRVDQGIVYARGPQAKEVRVGDHVLFGGYDGDKVAIEGEGVFIVMREWNLQLVMEEPETTLITTAMIRQFIGVALHQPGCDTAEKLAERINGALDGYFHSKGLEF